MTTEIPSPSSTESARIAALFHFCRLQLPIVEVDEEDFRAHLHRTFGIYSKKIELNPTWPAYLDGIYALDWLVCIGCLEGQTPAWEMLFAARTGRTDTLLVDALRARACRLYPRDEERQESAVTEFWSLLIVPDNDATLPVLARYDGFRPLAPWLIRVFQNMHLSKLRSRSGSSIALPDDDIAVPMPKGETGADARRHEAFRGIARDWLGSISESERLILGLRWRYRLSQRDVAQVLEVHEGTVSRQMDKLREKALEEMSAKLTKEGWMGDDLEEFILTEMDGVLLDDPRLSADYLANMLQERGKKLPG